MHAEHDKNLQKNKNCNICIHTHTHTGMIEILKKRKKQRAPQLAVEQNKTSTQETEKPKQSKN